MEASGLAHVADDGHRVGPVAEIQAVNMVGLWEVMKLMDHGSRSSVGLDDSMKVVHGMAASRVSRDVVCLQAFSGTSRWAMLIGLGACF